MVFVPCIRGAWSSRAALISALVVGASGVGCGHTAARRQATLSNLRAGMHWVRGAEFGQARVLDREPPLDDLIGLPRAELETALGAARVCRAPLLAPCRVQGEILWPFYRAPDATEARGPVLVIEVDANARVTSALWRRVEMHAPDALDGDAFGDGASGTAVAVDASGPVIEAMP